MHFSLRDRVIEQTYLFLNEHLPTSKDQQKLGIFPANSPHVFSDPQKEFFKRRWQIGNQDTATNFSRGVTHEDENA